MIELVPITPGRESFDTFWRSLLVADWEGPDGPISLNADIELADLAGSQFFLNARLFLAALADENGAPATATGNLTRSFVAGLFDRLKFSQHTRESTLRFCKVINEHDVWPLHIARVVCECGGLAIRRKNRFHITKKGRALLQEDQAGALFRRLFLSYFRRFDLHYDFTFRNVPGLQETMAVILWRLDTVARHWRPVRRLAEQILLPAVLSQLRDTMTYEHDTEEWILAGYVVDPLFSLGLIERKVRSEWPGVTEKDTIRVTALWRSFLQFAWNTGGEQVAGGSSFSA